jgi:SAM-dependent methyltransferase
LRFGLAEPVRIGPTDDVKANTAAMWGSASWECVAETMADIHDRLVTALGPRPGERWLDVGTGAGAVALRAGRAGAEVTGLDLAAGLVKTARRRAAEQNLTIRFDVGDAEQLPYADASFDVVASAHGVVFAADHAAAARELARVCRPGGRLGITAWRTGGAADAFARLLARFQPPAPPGPAPSDWGRAEHVTGLLGDAFELEFVPEVWIQTGESGEAIWELLTACSPPFKHLVESLEADSRAELHAAWVTYYEGYRREGEIRAPNEYTLILGTRRAA